MDRSYSSVLISDSRLLTSTSECYWGNAAAYNTSENLGDCNMVCDGSISELCGGGNRILVYQDAAWVLLTDAEYAVKLQNVQSLLTQIQALMKTWQQALLTYNTALQAAIPAQNKRDVGTLTQQAQVIGNYEQQILTFYNTYFGK